MQTISSSALDLLVYDFDGVMTDNRVQIDQTGSESVACNRADGLGVDQIRTLGLPQIILSTETNPVVRARADKLKLFLLQGVQDKRHALVEYCAQKGYALDRVLYVGNDVNDLTAMQVVGYKVCPADAHPTIRNLATWVVSARGGEGVIREIADRIVRTKVAAPSSSEGASGLSELASIRKQLENSIHLRKVILDDSAVLQRIGQLAQAIGRALKNGRKVIFAGNGGSFADAQHLAAEFVGRFMMEREPLSAVCLGTNSSLSTAVGNDYHFDDIFLRELKALGMAGDIFIVISTSGQSRNLIKAVEFAGRSNIETYGLLGKGGGQIARMVPSIVIPSDHTARIQELHITIGHIVCDLVDTQLSGTSPLP